MQLNRCPICHSRISLEAMVQDEAGRELLGLLSIMHTERAAALIAYLGLFRSATRDLSNDKACRLTKEIIGMSFNSNLEYALRKTVESLQGKGGKPLTNHNYLQRVLADCKAGADMPSVRLDTPLGVPGVTHTGPEQRPTNTFMPLVNGKLSKTAQALQSLEDFGNE